MATLAIFPGARSIRLNPLGAVIVERRTELRKHRSSLCTMSCEAKLSSGIPITVFSIIDERQQANSQRRQRVGDRLIFTQNSMKSDNVSNLKMSLSHESGFGPSCPRDGVTGRRADHNILTHRAALSFSSRCSERNKNGPRRKRLGPFVFRSALLDHLMNSISW